MNISAIVATAHGHVIGAKNQIPWYLPADLAWFKRHTLNHCVIMGRKCFRSIGRPLPKRTNIVVSRDPFFVADGVEIVYSLEAALELAFDRGETEAFIIGGGEIYRASVDQWDTIYWTEVDVAVEGDVFFPKINPDEWEEVFRESHLADEKNEWNYVFRILNRKK
jgi:dihydrofolate reductase